MELIKYTILIVDDDADVRGIVEALLSNQGHSCDVATDGIDALKKTDEKRFDAVITDVNMPKMNGIDLARRLLNRTPSLPVMIMTGSADESSRRILASIGVRSFISKPFNANSFASVFFAMMKEYNNL